MTTKKSDLTAQEIYRIMPADTVPKRLSYQEVAPGVGRWWMNGELNPPIIMFDEDAEGLCIAELLSTLWDGGYDPDFVLDDGVYLLTLDLPDHTIGYIKADNKLEALVKAYEATKEKT